MLIYELVFGQDYGQVHCAFHNDQKCSAGISPEGMYHCFTCNASAHDEVGFIAKYFNVSLDRAEKIKTTLEKSVEYSKRYNMLPLTAEQTNYLNSIGIKEPNISKYFFCTGVGKLYFKHMWNGIDIGYTWFNNSNLTAFNASASKYVYYGIIGGMTTPYDDVIKYDTLIICEGEKDMLTARSLGIPNAVAKIGGAATPLICGENYKDKKVIIVYDCDDAGMAGAIRDAQILTTKFNCQVKVVNLNLNNKEDLNDYFMKYHYTVQDFYNLIKATPVFTGQSSGVVSKNRIDSFVTSLNDTELVELFNKLQTKINNKK